MDPFKYYDISQDLIQYIPVNLPQLFSNPVWYWEFWQIKSFSGQSSEGLIEIQYALYIIVRYYLILFDII